MSAPSRAQLDQTGERIRAATATSADWNVLTEYRLSVRDAVAPLLDRVRTIAKGSSFPFTARIKTNYSIEQKLRRTTIRLRQIDDIMGCRVIVPDRSTQDIVTAGIVTIGSAKVRDRRANPSNGYRAVHVILGDHSYLEVQVRTKYQDAWAELSERIADRHGIAFKYGGGSQETLSMLDLASLYIASVETDEPDPDFTAATLAKVNDSQIEMILEMARKDLL